MLRVATLFPIVPLWLSACASPTSAVATPADQGEPPPSAPVEGGAKSPAERSEGEGGESSQEPKAGMTPVAAPASIPAPADVAAPPADAEVSDSGLASVVLRPGEGGKPPGLTDRVMVHYTGWTSDGKMFDSSVLRGKKATFGVSQIIKGWTEGLQLMSRGEKRRFWIPAQLAYGDQPTRAGAPAGQLTFDVELFEIQRVEVIEVPEDVATPPAGAKSTASGLAYRVLTSGTGAHPGPEDQVTIHYSGWTSDGKMFDSSRTRGAPAQFPVDKVIRGLTEGQQLMAVGSSYRFWIPADLAYGDTPRRQGAPSGQLTFDVELIEIGN